MKAYLVSRSLDRLLAAITALALILFAPLGALPLPQIVPEEVAIDVPIRVVGMVVLGALPVVSVAAEMDILDRSGARPIWLLRLGPVALSALFTVILVAALSILAGVDADAMIRNVLLGSAAAALLHHLLGAVSFLPMTLVSLVAAVVREEHAWWAITNQPGARSGLLIAMLSVTVALGVLALTGSGPADQ